MRFVKIGYIYFNPCKIDLLKPDVYMARNKYYAFVEVWTSGRPHAVLAADLDLNLPEMETRAEALGIAEAMVDKITSMIEEALYGQR